METNGCFELLINYSTLRNLKFYSLHLKMDNKKVCPIILSTVWHHSMYAASLICNVLTDAQTNTLTTQKTLKYDSQASSGDARLGRFMDTLSLSNRVLHMFLVCDNLLTWSDVTCSYTKSDLVLWGSICEPSAAPPGQRRWENVMRCDF